MFCYFLSPKSNQKGLAVEKSNHFEASSAAQKNSPWHWFGPAAPLIPEAQTVFCLSTDETITSRFGGPNLLSFCVARKLRSPTMRLSRALTDTKFLTSKSGGYYFIGTNPPREASKWRFF